MKRTVEELMLKKKISGFACITPEASIFQALDVLDSSKSSTLLVTRGHELRGIFSEKDFARASIRKGIQLSDSVATAMTTKIYYVTSTFTLEECLQVMAMAHVRHLPVMDEGKPIALLSMRHIMEILIEDKETKIHELTSYIMGSNHIEGVQDQKNSKSPNYLIIQNREAL